ncbi:threonine/serine exporter family protein [Miniphocaeibacter halophilus]|uniref:Threonine/serine exporter family protein n=1 Tax=Miniphocaeibacter halophilus TaxID=2931922 RepID=A0AC61MMF9_9FIRM|nr:threonine/serine exporter family protein [Miniphocaeibacter halophilus]QQK06880.1 threonine/serine exporter family protein [Miniphocaeibacter halophilus]
MIYSSLWAFFCAFGFGIIFNIKGKNLFFASIGAFVGNIVFVLTKNITDSDIISYYFCAISFSLLAEIFAIYRKIPVSIFLSPSMIPFVPGAAILSTMENLVEGNASQTWQYGVYALQVSGAIAMGVITVSFVVKIWRNSIKKYFFKINGS